MAEQVVYRACTREDQRIYLASFNALQRRVSYDRVLAVIRARGVEEEFDLPLADELLVIHHRTTGSAIYFDRSPAHDCYVYAEQPA